MQDASRAIVSTIRQSQLLRLLLVGLLTLLLQIPIVMISHLISERQHRRQEAVEEVSSKWGRSQALTGPALVVPFTHRWSEMSPSGQQVTRTELRQVTLLPERLKVAAKLKAEVRQRGIFAVSVYTMDLKLEGEFPRWNLSELGVEPSTVAWERSQLSIGISDARSIQEQTSVSWNGQAIPFLPGTGHFGEAGTGIHAVVGDSAQAERGQFSFPLKLAGAIGVYFVPFAKETLVEVESDWRSPSFQGNWLPSQRSIAVQGFHASWNIPSLGRDYPQSWTSPANMRERIKASQFGVDLVEPIDAYRMAQRSVKYASLFILLTFGVIWLAEVMARLRVHPMQYLLLGAALCVFYLLELALAEHIGFGPAYLVATLLIVSLVAAYSVTVMRRIRRAVCIAGVVTVLYAYLYMLLVNEDYALLVGAIGLFVALALVMFITSRVDWYAIGSDEASTGRS